MYIYEKEMNILSKDWIKIGRTQLTYRIRLQQIREKLLKLMKSKSYKEEYKKLWIYAHNLSAPGSTFPWPDTYAVATYSMMLGIYAKIIAVEDQLNVLEESKQPSD